MDKFSGGTETIVLKETLFFYARKCLEAVYRAENQVVNGCTGTNIKPQMVIYCATVLLSTVSFISEHPLRDSWPIGE